MKFTNSFRKTIIAICSSLIFGITMGTIRLNSQLFVVVRELFGVDREQASLPFTLIYSVRNLSGPFIGFIGNKFGLRCAIVFGCLLSSVSLAACFLVKDIVPFTILWGIAFGIGSGLSTVLLQKILQLYFTNSFNLVQGIFLSAGSIGSIVFPGVGEYLLLTYGTSGTFLILSGFALHTVPLAMLLECPQTTSKIQSHSEIQEKGEIFEMTIFGIKNFDEKNGSKYVCRMTSDDVYPKKYYGCEDAMRGIFDASSLSNSNFNKDYTRNKKYQLNFTDSVGCKHKSAESGRDVLSKRNKYLAEQESQTNVVSRDGNSDSIENANFSFGKYLTCHAKKQPRDSSNFISQNFKVFFDPAYILMCISLSFILIPLMVLQNIMVDTWRDKGVSEDVTILMTFAVAEIVGSVGFGYLSDLKCTGPLKMYVLTSGIYGLLLIGFPWLNGFCAFVLFFAVVGAVMGGIVVTSPGVIRDYIEKENLTMAFSSRNFLFGLLFLTQPSVIGYFRETLHCYDGLFYLLGSMCIVGIVIALCVPVAARYRDKRRNKKKAAVQNVVQNVI